MILFELSSKTPLSSCYLDAKNIGGKSQEFISTFKVTQLSFAACKHTNAKSKF